MAWGTYAPTPPIHPRNPTHAYPQLLEGGGGAAAPGEVQVHIFWGKGVVRILGYRGGGGGEVGSFADICMDRHANAYGDNPKGRRVRGPKP